jgi:hypothetical protein
VVGNSETRGRHSVGEAVRSCGKSTVMGFEDRERYLQYIKLPDPWCVTRSAKRMSCQITTSIRR